MLQLATLKGFLKIQFNFFIHEAGMREKNEEKL